MKRICIIFLIFFVNFVSSCIRYVHDEPMYTGYAPILNCQTPTVSEIGHLLPTHLNQIS
jgi:hypothetical protein